MNRVVIRKAVEGDYNEVLKLYGEFVEDFNRYSNGSGDSFKKILEDSNSFLDRAILENKIVGFIGYSIRNVVRYPKPIIEIEEFFVKLENRRQGIGRKLMEHVLGFAKSGEHQYIFLASAKERKEAHEFYRALGFDEYAYHYKRKP